MAHGNPFTHSRTLGPPDSGSPYRAQVDSAEYETGYRAGQKAMESNTKGFFNPRIEAKHFTRRKQAALTRRGSGLDLQQVIDMAAGFEAGARAAFKNLGVGVVGISRPTENPHQPRLFYPDHLDTPAELKGGGSKNPRSRPLPSTVNSPAIARRIERAFRSLHRRQLPRSTRIETFYEHGQWFVILHPSGATYSVHDAAGTGEGTWHADGFSFELLSHGVDGEEF